LVIEREVVVVGGGPTGSVVATLLAQWGRDVLLIAAGGQTVMHFHCHVIPRYIGDMSDPRGGIRHCIPEKGNYCP